MLKRLFGGQPAAEPAIEPRDTDADWRKLGEHEPYFGVITDPRFLRANLTEAARDEFYATGLRGINNYLRLMRQRFGRFQPRSALDFGCGVGRLTAALAQVTGDALGVDISPGMLAEARRIDQPGLQFSTTLPDRQFDWVVSIIVFQHIPPERGYDLLRELLARVAPGGGITLQVTLFRDPRHAQTPGSRITGGGIASGEPVASISTPIPHQTLPVGEMMMFDYDLSIIFALLVQAGIGEPALRHTDHGGFHGALIWGRKPG